MLKKKKNRNRFSKWKIKKISLSTNTRRPSADFSSLAESNFLTAPMTAALKNKINN